MADFSFKQFIEERSKKTKKRTFQFVSEINVLILYGEYVAWLADFSARQKEAPKITASEMLVQLKIINAYHLYLIDQYNKSKSLIKPIELTPVPEALMPENEPNPKFILPNTNALPDNFDVTARLHLESKFKKRLFFAFFCALTIALSVITVLFAVKLAPFIVASLLAPLVTGSALVIGASLVGLLYAKLPIIDKPNELSLYNKKYPLALVGTFGILCGVVVAFVPLPTFAFVSLLTVASIVPAFAAMALAANLCIRLFTYREHDSTQEILQKLHKIEKQDIIVQHKTPLLAQIDPLHQAHPNKLGAAITATTHCLISSRMSREIAGITSTNNNEEIDLSVLHGEVQRQLRLVH